MLLSVSEQAVLTAVKAGACTVEAVRRLTGAAGWWVQLNIDALVERGVLVRRDGKVSAP